MRETESSRVCMYHGDTWRLKFICLGVALLFHLDFLRQGLSFLPPGCILDSELLVCSPATPLTVGTPGIQMHTSTSGFLHGIWKSNSDCQACTDVAFTHRAVSVAPGWTFICPVLYQAHWLNVVQRFPGDSGAPGMDSLDSVSWNTEEDRFF